MRALSTHKRSAVLLLAQLAAESDARKKELEDAAARAELAIAKAKAELEAERAAVQAERAVGNTSPPTLLRQRHRPPRKLIACASC